MAGENLGRLRRSIGGSKVRLEVAKSAFSATDCAGRRAQGSRMEKTSMVARVVS